MSPDEIRRSWDDDDTPRSVFPEPPAERLTRENKELRAENERLRGTVARLNRRAQTAEAAVNEMSTGTGRGKSRAVATEMWARCQTVHERGCPRAEAAEARLDALVSDLRGLADEWNRLMGWPRNVGAPALAFVLDKHAGGSHD